MTAKRGFTLLELLLVLFMLSVAFAVIYPSFVHWKARAQLEAATSMLSYAIRMAKAKARQAQSPYCVHIQADTDSYSVGPAPTCEGRTMSPSNIDLENEVLVTFYPPYGTKDPIQREVRMHHRKWPSFHRAVYIYGVVGKVAVGQ